MWFRRAMTSPNGGIRFWQIPELVERCLSNLERNDYGDRKTLARCARLTKPVSGIALERLWDRMFSLKYLFQLLNGSIGIHVRSYDALYTRSRNTYVS